MTFIRASVLATGAFFCLSSVTLLALPHPAFAAIHLGDPNTVSLTQGLVGYWPLDGSTINWNATPTFYDISGNGNNATSSTMSTSSSPVGGKIGQALKFNGSSSYLSLGNASSLKPSLPLSLSAWIKVDNFNNFYNIVHNDASPNV